MRRRYAAVFALYLPGAEMLLRAILYATDTHSARGGLCAIPTGPARQRVFNAYDPFVFHKRCSPVICNIVQTLG